jgi:hypothetical protein
MIQRIQTIWLLISAISSGFLMKGGITYFTDKAGESYFTGFSGIYKLSGSGHELITTSIPLAALIIAIPLLSVVSIFLFKSRRIQKVVTMVVIAFSLCLIILVIFYSYLIMKNYSAEFVPGVKMVIPLIIMSAAALAYRGITGDDRLVKSYDRLR